MRINTFYRNVSKKYKHTYSLELMEKNVNDSIDSMYQIEKTLHRRKPTMIILSKEMREAVFQAERDLEVGKCLSEAAFKERFAKWL